MRTTRLAFNDLQNSFDVIARENLRSIKGGVAEADPDWGTWNGIVYTRTPGGEWEYYATLPEVNFTLPSGYNPSTVFVLASNPFGVGFGSGDGSGYVSNGDTGGNSGSSGGTTTSPYTIDVSMTTEIYGSVTVQTFTLDNLSRYNFINSMSQAESFKNLLISFNPAMSYKLSLLYGATTFLASEWADINTILESEHYNGNLHITTMSTINGAGVPTKTYHLSRDDGSYIETVAY